MTVICNAWFPQPASALNVGQCNERNWPTVRVDDSMAVLLVTTGMEACQTQEDYYSWVIKATLLWVGLNHTPLD